MTKYVNILTQTKDDELGYALDSRYYGIPDFNQYMKDNLAKLTLEDVNNAIKKHFEIRQNANRVGYQRRGRFEERNWLKINPAKSLTPRRNRMEVTNEDKIISTFPIPVKAADITRSRPLLKSLQ